MRFKVLIEKKYTLYRNNQPYEETPEEILERLKYFLEEEAGYEIVQIEEVF